MGIDRLIHAFLSTLDAASPKQIIALGAGTDTRPFRVFSQTETQGLIYHEIDFEVVCTKKLRTVNAVPMLSRILEHAAPLSPPTTSRANEEKDQSVNSASWSSRTPGGGEFYCHGID